MLLQDGKLCLHIFGLMGEDFLQILRASELLGMIECCLDVRFGETEHISIRFLALDWSGSAASSALADALRAAPTNLSKALRASSTLFAVKSRISGGISWGNFVMADTLPRSVRPISDGPNGRRAPEKYQS